MKKNNQYGRTPQFDTRMSRRLNRRSPSISMGRNSEKFENIPLPRLLFKDAEDIKVDDYSQPEVLKRHMDTAGLTHGQTILANLKNVRVDNNGVLYFCPMEDDDLEILQRVSAGDGQEIPEEVALVGNFTINRFMPGYFNLKNVAISSNGSIQVIARTETMWEKVTV